MKATLECCKLKKGPGGGSLTLGLLVLAAGACSESPNVDAPLLPTAPPSCAQLPKTCGPTGDGDCCESLQVPGGSFLRNNDPALPATVSSYRLDKYEITVGRFRQFLDAYDAWRAEGGLSAGLGAHSGIAASGWDPAWPIGESAASIKLQLKCDRTVQTWTDAPGGNETRPLSCLNWYEAFAFCAWDGGRLPTLAEWNIAASAGNEQREYPWSVPPTDTTINPEYASYYSMQDCLGDGEPGCKVTDLVAVGSKPRGNGKYGHADLAGNVREWVLDKSRSYPNPCVDCAALGPGELRALRGGAWNNLDVLVKSSAELEDYPENHYLVIGARCARK
ncbi:MAG: SUMF1/EgtB/PvdO family nonheme iron enzyme [Polyangiaceae bacterium]|nr:SUMF1/EgtB/PvdO family nonheme iron enzyme [Polyangiaceae bacterium]